MEISSQRYLTRHRRGAERPCSSTNEGRIGVFLHHLNQDLCLLPPALTVRITSSAEQKYTFQSPVGAQAITVLWAESCLWRALTSLWPPFTSTGALGGTDQTDSVSVSVLLIKESQGWEPQTGWLASSWCSVQAQVKEAASPASLLLHLCSNCQTVRIGIEPGRKGNNARVPGWSTHTNRSGNTSGDKLLGPCCGETGPREGSTELANTALSAEVWWDSSLAKILLYGLVRG